MAGASTVGKLIIDMAADVSQLKTDMNSASQAVEAAGQKIESAASAAKAALIGMTAAMGPAAIVSMVDSVISAAAELDRLSVKTGATVEALSALKGVAKQSGTDMESVGMSLQKLSKNMLDAAAGGGSADKAFQALKLSVRDSNGNLKDSGDFMQEVAKKLFDMGSGTQRVAYAQQIFGKQGAQLLPMLRDLAQTGELNGKITAEQARQAEEFERKMAKLQITAKGAAMELASALLPSLNDIAGMLVEAKNETDKMRTSTIDLAKENSLESWADDAAVGVARLVDVVKIIPQLFSAITASAKVVGADIKTLSAGFKELNPVHAAWAIAHGQDPLADFKAAAAERDKILQDANAKYAQLWNEPANKMEQAILGRIAGRNTSGEDAVDAASNILLGKKKSNPPIESAAADDAKSQYDQLIKQIKEKIAVSEQELKSTVQLSDGEKEQAKILESVQNGSLKLTEAQKANVKQLVEVMAADSRAVEAKKQAIEVEKNVKAYINQTEIARSEAAKQIETELSLYGKSTDERELAMIAIKAEAEADKKIAELKKGNTVVTQEQTDAIRDEARALGESEQARVRNSKALAYATQLHEENKRFSVEAIADSRERAAALLQIDAEMWQKRIAAAGDGTEAQKKLQEEFNQWYANQLNKPVLDQWHKTIDQLDSDFHQGFTDMLTKGAGAWESFTKSLGNTLKAALADALYKTFIQKYVVNIVASLAGFISGPSVASSLAGSAGAGGATSALSTAGNIAGISSMFGAGGLGGALAGGAGWLTGATSFTGALSAAGSLIGTGSAAGIMSGLGVAAGALGPVVLGALALKSIIGGGGETRYGGGYDVLNGKVTLGGGPSGGEIQGDKVQQAIQGAYDGLTSALRDLGSSATIGRFTAGLESSEKGKGATFAGGFINGQQFGSTYETTTYNQTLTQDQAVAQFTQKLQQSVLLALQAAGDIPKSIMDQLNSADIKKMTADQATALISSINSEITSVKSFQAAIVNLPFENLKNLSFDAANGLIAAAGGLDKLNSGLSTYYDKFFTSQEKTANTTKQVSEELSKLGFDHLPKTRDEFRQMVDAQDLTTESGQKTYAALLNLAGALDTLLPPLNAVTSAVSGVGSAAGGGGSSGVAVNDGTYNNYSVGAGRLTGTVNGISDFNGVDVGNGTYWDSLKGFVTGIPKFAAGGAYRGCMALVGENGPEIINFDRPGYVHNSSQTATMLGGADVSAKLDAIIQELRADKAQRGEVGSQTIDALADVKSGLDATRRVLARAA